MSYYQGPPGQPPYNQQQPYAGQGWGQPAPPQGGYAPPPHPPPGQPPYQQQPYGGQGWQQGPPQGGYAPPPGPPQNQQYGQPQFGSPYPPQQGFAPPPGPPPPGQGYQQQFAGNQYGQPAGGYGSAPGAPSKGYIPGRAEPDGPHFNAASEAQKARGAMKGFGTDETALITVLSSLNGDQITSVKNAYRRVDRLKERDLLKDVHGETSGYFREGLEAIIRGPLEQDCYVLRESIKGIGTKESALNEVLLGRSNADLMAIKQQYQKMYGHSLESDVKGDLSMKTERLFDMVMSARRAEETAPVIPQQIDADVQELYRATEGQTGADQISVSQVLSSKSDAQLRAISLAYKQKFHRSLDEVIRKEFSGHMEQAFLYMLHKAEDPAKLDADLLEESMKGAGTKDVALVRRIIAVHWDPERLRQCKAAYKHFYKRELATRIQGETSGDYEKLMLGYLQATLNRIVDSPTASYELRRLGSWYCLWLCDTQNTRGFGGGFDYAGK